MYTYIKAIAAGLALAAVCIAAAAVEDPLWVKETLCILVIPAFLAFVYTLKKVFIP